MAVTLCSMSPIQCTGSRYAESAPYAYHIQLFASFCGNLALAFAQCVVSFVCLSVVLLSFRTCASLRCCSIFTAYFACMWLLKATKFCNLPWCLSVCIGLGGMFCLVLMLLWSWIPHGAWQIYNLWCSKTLVTQLGVHTHSSVKKMPNTTLDITNNHCKVY